MEGKPLDFIFPSNLARIWGAPEYSAVPQHLSMFAVQEGLLEKWLVKRERFHKGCVLQNNV